MEKSSFFNSINGDRRYKAQVFAEYFSSFIGNGIFPNPATNLQVIAINNDMTITIKKGSAWINGYYYMNTDDLIFKLDPADGVLNRIDRVVLRLDFLNRRIKADIKKGEWDSIAKAKEVQRDADAYEIALADIYIKNGAISITQADITDLRLNKSLCGIVHGTVDQADTTAIFNQFESWYSQTKSNYDKDIATWTKEKKETFQKWYSDNTAAFLNQFNTWYSDNTNQWTNDFTNWFKNTEVWEKEFKIWFDTVKNILEGDVAAKLYNKISEIEDKLNNIDLSADKIKVNNSNFKATDVNNALNELFTYADSGKKSIANVIGSPLSANDTFIEQANEIQDLKNNFATKLTNKGQISNNKEALKNLIDKVDNIKVGDYSVGDTIDYDNLTSENKFFEIWRFTSRKSRIYGLAVDKNGYIYSGSQDNAVRKISPNGIEIWCFTGHSGGVYGVAVDDKGYVYSCGGDKTVRKISPNGIEIWCFTGHTSSVNAVAVDNKGNVYSGSGGYQSLDKTVRKISPDGKEVWCSDNYADYIEALTIDKDGYIYVGTFNYVVEKIPSDGGRRIWSFTGHSKNVSSIAVDDNGNVYTGSWDRTVRKINYINEEQWKFTGNYGYVNAVAVDNKGNVYSGSSDKTVRKISSYCQQIWSFTGHSDEVTALAVDKNGYIYSGSQDGVIIKFINKTICTILK